MINETLPGDAAAAGSIIAAYVDDLLSGLTSGRSRRPLTAADAIAKVRAHALHQPYDHTLVSSIHDGPLATPTFQSDAKHWLRSIVEDRAHHIHAQRREHDTVTHVSDLETDIAAHLAALLDNPQDLDSYPTPALRAVHDVGVDALGWGIGAPDPTTAQCITHTPTPEARSGWVHQPRTHGIKCTICPNTTKGTGRRG